MLVTEEGFTEELLQQHTQEYEKLSAKYDTMRNILEVYENCNALILFAFTLAGHVAVGE